MLGSPENVNTKKPMPQGVYSSHKLPVWFSSFLVLAALSCLLISGSVQFSFSPSGFNGKRVLLVSLAGLMVMTLCLPTGFSGAIRRVLLVQLSRFHPVIRGGILLVFVLGIFSSVTSAYPEKGLQEVGLYGLLLLLTGLVSISPLGEKVLHTWLWGILVGLALYSLGYVFQYVLYLEYRPLPWKFSVQEYSNPRSFNHVQGWLIPLMALLPIVASERCKGISRFGLSALYFYLLVTAVRGLPLALVFSFITSILLFRVQTVQLLKVHFRSFLLGLVVYLVLCLLVPWLLEQGVVQETTLYRLRKDNSDRTDLWIMAIRLFQDAPWFGLGPQQFVISEAVYSSPHNIILQWLSEWGGPATVLLTGMSVYAGYSFLTGLRYRIATKAVSNALALVQVAVFMSLLTSGFYAQISGVFITPLSQLLMVLIAGVAIRFHFDKADPQIYPLNLWEKAIWVSLLTSLIMVFYWIFYQEFWLGEYVLFRPMEPDAPRFWLNGNFTQ